MTTDSRLNRAAQPIFFIDDEGKEVEYLVSPLGDKDMTELDEWVRATFIRAARQSLGDDCTDRERKETLALAMDQAIGMSFMSGIGSRMMGTVDGITRLVWQSCKINHPTLTLAELKALMFNKANIAEANRIWAEMNLGKSKPKPTAEATVEPGKSRKRRRQKRKSTKH